MASSQVFLSDLKSGCFVSGRRGMLGAELMSVDKLLLDSKDREDPSLLCSSGSNTIVKRSGKMESEVYKGSLEHCISHSSRTANYIYISHLQESSAYAPEVVGFKEESALFARFKSRLLLGDSGQDHLGNGKSS
ncbi:hypothetical protein DY000_02041448 [Brassica cretica]|uniref:Uncharacterized protein n=1 Tax=Brassica cretica TaxID=69181 RepID=A0ABQ7B8A8_BRACR|nr:hypothetical protein DY000_02041448 [Brassica cretica]